MHLTCGIIGFQEEDDGIEGQVIIHTEGGEMRKVQTGMVMGDTG